MQAARLETRDEEKVERRRTATAVERWSGKGRGGVARE
jgi:hypothetical protein